MNKDKYPLYALAAVAGAGMAIWAGLPPTYLPLLICPAMMFFMMGRMGRMGSEDGQREDVGTCGAVGHATRLVASPP